MSTYKITARHWSGGWELHIEGVGVTQCRNLSQADQQARDYIETLTGVADAEVEVTPDISNIEDVRAARAASRAAAEAQERAAAQSREVARELRSSGLSVTDVATVMDVSRGRVSQLTRT